MTDTKLSALVELAATPAVDDELYIRDVSEAATDESKRITVANLAAIITPGASVVTGSYTGNAAETARQITTGMKCSMVVILAVAGGDKVILVIIPNEAISQKAAVTFDITAKCVIHATDGFTVSFNNLEFGNLLDQVYYYWAISE